MSRLLLSLLLGTLAAGCIIVAEEHSSKAREQRHDTSHEHDKAYARIEGKSGSSLSGKATFTQVEHGVIVELRVESTAPGWHAVHVHEVGDCSAEDGTSAGGHFNPGGDAHGSPHAAEHHAGDLGNMWVDEHGEGHHVLLMPGLTVEEGPRSVVGRAIVVHAAIDDLASQPTGNAGGRIGCGVIR